MPTLLLFRAIVIGVLIAGCDKAPAAAAEATGCTKDSDCKGDRVCDKGACVEPTAAPAIKADAEQAAKPAEPAVAAAPNPSADADVAHAPAETATSCKALVEHVQAILVSTPDGAGGIDDPAKEIASCETRANDPKISACLMAASDQAGLDACAIAAFGDGVVDATPGRSFKGLDDNSAADPPVFAVDGDYMSWDEDCGLLMREIPPTGGLFVVCKGKVQIGPIVNGKQLETVMAQVADQSRSQHELVMGIINNYPTGKLGVRVHKYDADGRYVGVEER